MRRRKREPEPEYLRKYREFMIGKDPMYRGGPSRPDFLPPHTPSRTATRASDAPRCCCCHCHHAHTA
jgi:hypothetical protein